MKKHWKEIIFILPSFAVAAAAVLGFQKNIPIFLPITYPEKNVVRAAEESPAPDGEAAENDNVLGDDSRNNNSRNINSKDNGSGRKLRKVSYTGDGAWKDGIYTGSGTGFGGLIEVSVTITDGKITKIQILSCPGETPSYLEQARAVVPQMLAAQSPNVDTVSGATYSSNGIRAAVIQALNKAGGNLPAETQPAVENKEPGRSVKKTVHKKTSPVTKGQPADGVYSGSAVCERFGYTVGLKVRFQKGKTTSLYGLKITGNEDKANEAYWKKAWKPIVNRILKAQDAQVDVVSGATYSSNAIMEAYQDARAKAVNVGKNKDIGNKNEKTAPTPAPTVLLPDDAPQVTGTAKDGVYTVSAICEPDEKKAFAAYTMTADVAFADGKCISIGNFRSTDESNRSYYLKAADGTAKASGVVGQILLNQSASGISAVSGATCSSKTIRLLYLQALSDATGVGREELTDGDDGSFVAQTPVPSPSVLPTAVPSGSPVPTPSLVPAAPGDGSGGTAVKDGTYTASARVIPDEWEEFIDYSLTADVTFSGGKLIGIANLVLEDTSNQWYCNAAANGYGSQTGIIQQLIDRQGEDVDAVSEATCSSLALVEIYKNALEMAMGPTPLLEAMGIGPES